VTVSKLAVTGYPGWLATAFLAALNGPQYESPGEILAIVHPDTVEAARKSLAQQGLPFEVVAYDLAQPAPLYETLRGVDVLVHSAAIIHVKSTKDWYRVNTEGTIALARDAKAAGVSRFVYISSIAAAGKSTKERDLIEEDVPHPAHHYGKSKLLAERALMALHEPGVFDVVILRPSMFYGPPVPQRHIEIYERIRAGWMPLVGNGAYRRSIVYIANLVDAVVRALTVPGAAGRTYFIVDRTVCQTRDVTDTMGEVLGVKPRYVRLPAALAELAYQIDRVISSIGIYIAPIHLLGESHWHQAASCDRAVRELGYDPRIGLKEGMRAAIDWSRQSGKLP
jgi:nucleoside-diphosphate-sugar epimerase